MPKESNGSRSLQPTIRDLIAALALPIPASSQSSPLADPYESVHSAVRAASWLRCVSLLGWTTIMNDSITHTVLKWALISLLGVGAANGQTPDSAEATCNALSGTRISAAEIRLPTGGAKIAVVSFETAVDDKPVSGGFCKILGAINPVDPSAPSIQFEVNLPSSWNGKMLQFGGGFFDGALVSGLRSTVGAKPGSASPLVQAYVTLGSDSGHQRKAVDDASFALNAESLRNFGGDQVQKTLDVALFLVKARYRKTPVRTYFIGGSQGGHEALIAAQRFGADYNGIVSVFPAYNLVPLHLASNAIARAGYGHGGRGWLGQGKLKLLHDAVLEACDALDGLKDGIVSDVAGCRHVFTIATVKSKMRCPRGVDTGDTCLSDAQIDTVRTVDSPLQLPFPLADGQRAFPRWPLLEGATFFDSFGEEKTPSHPGVDADSMLYRISDAGIRYIYTNDPSIDSIDGFSIKDHRQTIVTASAMLDSTSTDLTEFRNKGGKLLLIHGTADESVTPYSSIDYYRRLQARYGQARLDNFVRFYLIPGYGHYSGVFDARWDPLEVLDAWVDRNVVPGTLTASDGNTGASRSRPMCVYPSWPKYDGHGDVNTASSFTCTE